MKAKFIKVEFSIRVLFNNNLLKPSFTSILNGRIFQATLVNVYKDLNLFEEIFSESKVIFT